MDIRPFLHPQRLVSAPAVIPQRISFIGATALVTRQSVSEVCLRVGTEWTNYHITQRALPTRQVDLCSLHHQPATHFQSSRRQCYQATLVAAGPWELPTPYQPPASFKLSSTHYHGHSTHHHDHCINTIRVAAGPWELPTSCQSPTKSSLPHHHHHHPTDMIRPTSDTPDDDDNE